MTLDEAIGYLLRDAKSVEAEAARAILDEMSSRGDRIEYLRKRLDRAHQAVLQMRHHARGHVGEWCAQHLEAALKAE